MEDRRKLLNDFLDAFRLETLKDMPLEKYTNQNRSDSFCYWVESRTYASVLYGVGQPISLESISITKDRKVRPRVFCLMIPMPGTARMAIRQKKLMQ